MIHTKERPTNDPDKLLKLIKEGDAELLLAEGDLGKGFNELINLDLIAIEEGKVSITKLGEEALKEGIGKVMANKIKAPEVQPVLTNGPGIKPKLHRKIWFLVLLLLLFTLVLLVSQTIQ